MRSWPWAVLTLGGLLIATVFVFFSLFRQFDVASTSAADGPLIAWLVEHGRQWWAGEVSLYELPFFYPYAKTLTYSDPFISSGLIALVVSKIWPNIGLIEQLNTQLILGTIGYGMAVYWLIRVVGGRGAAALLLTLIATFVPLRFWYVVHLHSFMVIGLPIGLASIITYLRTNKKRYLISFGIAYLFQVANSPMTALFLVVMILIWLLSQKKRWIQLKTDKWLQVVGVGLFAVSILLYWPYWQQAISEGALRTLRDAAHFSYSLNRLFAWDVLVLFGFAAALILTTRKSKQRVSEIIPWILITFVGFVSLLGPILKINGETVRLFGLPIPLPYSLAFVMIPGLQAFRAVTRWSIVASLGMSLWLAVAIRHSRVRRFFRFGGLVIFAGASIVSAKRFLPVFTLPTAVPPIYMLAAEQSEETMAVLPAYTYDMEPYAVREPQRLLYQPASNKVYYNGASGYLPPARAEEIHLLYRQFPDDTTIDLFRKLEISVLLVEYDEYQSMYEASFVFDQVPAPDPAMIRQHLEQRADIALIGCREQACLYRLVSP